MITNLRLMSGPVALGILLAGVGALTMLSNTNAPSTTPIIPRTTPTNTGKAVPRNQPEILPAGTATATREDAFEQSKATISLIPEDTRVVINAPAFRMDLFEDGKLIKSYKIGIGYPEFPLPTGLRIADTIIFNPTWTPPDEPWVESPNSKVKVGQRIEAGDKLNPLGLIKIPIGLPSLIHGGKAPAQIGSFASHGCVVLTNPQVRDFAKHLARISGTQISDEQIAEYEKNRTETRSVKLSQAVPVELRYETVTVEDGKLHIYRDVYERGANTADNLRNVLQAYGVTVDRLSESQRSQVTDALGQMARDARGNPVVEPAGVERSVREKGDFSAVAPKSTSSKNRDEIKDEDKPKNKASGKVTRTIKGEKEVVIEIAALRGKGYPAPVGLDAGVVSKEVVLRSR